MRQRGVKNVPPSLKIGGQEMSGAGSPLLGNETQRETSVNVRVEPEHPGETSLRSRVLGCATKWGGDKKVPPQGAEIV